MRGELFYCILIPECFARVQRSLFIYSMLGISSEDYDVPVQGDLGKFIVIIS